MEVYPDVPVRVEYELTEKGRDLEPMMNEVQRWANKWYDGFAANGSGTVR